MDHQLVSYYYSNIHALSWLNLAEWRGAYSDPEQAPSTPEPEVAEGHTGWPETTLRSGRRGHSSRGGQRPPPEGAPRLWFFSGTFWFFAF
jgi:hypothetical protein